MTQSEAREALGDIEKIPLIAGYSDDDQPVLEQVDVRPITDKSGQFRLDKSPAFVRLLAAGDRIRYPAETDLGYELLQRSGNLCLRVLRKRNIDEVEKALTPDMELIEGRLDINSPALLVYTVHVSIGFKTIEDTLDPIMGRFPGTVWYYGNVYDPQDGVTPLNWWQEVANDI